MLVQSPVCWVKEGSSTRPRWRSTDVTERTKGDARRRISTPRPAPRGAGARAPAVAVAAIQRAARPRPAAPPRARHRRRRGGAARRPWDPARRDARALGADRGSLRRRARQAPPSLRPRRLPAARLDGRRASRPAAGRRPGRARDLAGRRRLGRRAVRPDPGARARAHAARAVDGRSCRGSRLAYRLLPPERCLVVGDNRRRRFAEKIAVSPVRAVVVARLPIEEAHELTALDPTCGRLAGVRRMIRDLDVQRVVIPSAEDAASVADLVRTLESLSVQVSIVPRTLEVMGSAVAFDELDGMTLLSVRRFACRDPRARSSGRSTSSRPAPASSS